MSKQGEKVLIGNIFGLIGSIMMLIGPFLPWVQLGIIKADAFQKAPDYAYIIVGLGILALLICIVGLVMRKMVAIVNILISVIGAGIVIYLFVLLKDDMAGRAVFDLSPSIGPGPFVAGLGAVLIFIGAAVTATVKK